MKKNVEISVVTNHFFPFTRASGPVNYLKNLVDELNRRRIKNAVICYRKDGEKKQYTYHDTEVYKHRPYDIFHLRNIIKKTRPEKILVVSTISRTSTLIPYYMLLGSALTKYPTYFYQVTNISERTIFLKRLLPLLSYRFQRMIVGNDDLKEAFSTRARDTAVVYPSVPISNQRNTRRTHMELDDKDSTFTIGFFGHIALSKGTDIFIEIAKKRPHNSFLLVAGKSKNPHDETLYENILKNSTKIPNLQYIGYCNNPLQYMERCNLTIFPYRTSDAVLAVALSVIESLSLGVPTIVTNTPALTTIVKNGINGYVCRNKNEIIQRIDFLQNNSDVYNELVRNSTRTVEEKFNINMTTNKLLSLLDEKVPQ